MMDDKLQFEETNRQMAKTQLSVELCAKKQAELRQFVSRFITSQSELNEPIEEDFDKLLEAQRRNRQKISDLLRSFTT
jgi:hypothetical protein